MKNKIIMDSSCDIKDFSETDFSSVPLKIITDKNEFTDNDTLNVKDMVEFLKKYKGKTTTTCPSVSDYIDTFADAENVYVITITSALSGSYNAASVAASQYALSHPDCNIHVFDSLSVGPEMLLLAEKISSLILKNYSFKDIISEVEKYKNTTRLLFSLQSLHNLANNGRISHAVAKVVGMLGVRLIGKASEVGKLEPMCKSRGERKNISDITKQMMSLGYVGKKLHIAHCFNEEAAIMLKKNILTIFPSADISIYPTGGLCSFYAEEGGLLIGFEV